MNLKEISTETMHNTAQEAIDSVIKQMNMPDVYKADYFDCCDHGELVAMITDLMSEELALTETQRLLLREAALVHDIGKLQLSKNIYGRNKEALQITETRQMRLHATYSAEMLKYCGFDEDVVETVLHHHESFDGSGYPDNLSEDKIPVNARILKICDEFAALISDRPYRKGYSPEETMQLMIKNSKEYEMRLFLSFMKLYNSRAFGSVIEFAEEINRKHRYYE